MSIKFEDFKEWADKQNYYVFSGCVEENYPAIKEGILFIGKFLNHFMHSYKDQSCCSGPLTKMGLGNKNTLAEYTKANISLRQYNEKIMLTSCNGCYSYMIKSGVLKTDIAEIIGDQLVSAEDKKEQTDKVKDIVDIYREQLNIKKKQLTIKNQIQINQSTSPNSIKSKSSSKSTSNSMFLLHAIEYIAMFFDRLKYLVKFNLNGLKFVIQYGCHYLNQYRLSNEYSFRNLYAGYKGIPWQYNSVPTYMEDIIIPLGGQIREYNELLLCCGGSTPQRQINIDNSIAVAEKKFESIHSVEPDAIVTNCPLCMYFMEDSQNYPKLENRFKRKVPIIHINELFGILLGNEEIIEQVKTSHKIDPSPIIDKIIEE
ncbi:MAG: heterodisulfide reductase-related iron-sulfur binding cluster [Promethearchaeota archaeon]